MHRTFGPVVAALGLLAARASHIACAVSVALAKGAPLLAAAALTSLTATAAPVPAPDSWPARAVRLVVPHVSGDPADLIALPLAEALSEQLGQPVLLDHRPGLDGELGAEIVARSPADGYTFLLGSVEHAIAAAARPAPAYDLQRDLAPVTLLAMAPAVLVVDAAGPIGTLAELRSRANSESSRPASLAAFARNRLARLASEQFEATGSTPTTFAIVPLPAALAAIRVGSLRPLAVTGRSRSFALPDVPTLEQAGLTSVHAQTWHALWAPAGTADEIKVAMQRQVAVALDRKTSVDAWNRMGFERGGQPAHVLELTVRSEVLNWGQVLDGLAAKPGQQGIEGLAAPGR